MSFARLKGSMHTVLSLTLSLLLVFAAVLIGSLSRAQAAEEYQLGRMWGTLGYENGQLDSPIGVAVDSSGNVYVADKSNHRIQKFDSSGSFLAKWGSLGSGNGQFIWPKGVAVDSFDNVYVLDDRIQKFDSSGSFLAKWGSYGSGNGQFSGPSGIAIDLSNNNVYIADSQNHRVQKFNSSGTFLAKWDSAGRGDGQFEIPRGVAVDSSGNVYVGDSGNYFDYTIVPRIQKFDSSGNFLLKWGSYGSGNGQLAFPWGIAVDSSGNVYVADSDNHRVQQFTSSGAFVTKWGSYGSGEGQFREPLGLATDSSDNIYVTDYANSRIKKFIIGWVIATTPSPTPAPSAYGWFKTNPAITLTADESTPTTHYSWDSAALDTTYTTPFSMPGQGSHTLYYRSIGESSTETVKSRVFRLDTAPPAAPTLSAPARSTDVSKTRVFRVSWSGGSDPAPASGIGSYDVKYKIGASGSWRTWKRAVTARAADFTGSPGNTYYFSARNLDKAGNASAWSAEKKTIVPYDNNSAVFSRTGFAGLYANSRSSFYMGTVRFSTAPGESITYRFSGKSVHLIGTRAASRSKAKVYIDGRYIRTIDEYSATTKFRQVLYSKAWTSVGVHTIRFENLATPGRPRFDVDGLGVER